MMPCSVVWREPAKPSAESWRLSEWRLRRWWLVGWKGSSQRRRSLSLRGSPLQFLFRGRPHTPRRANNQPHRQTSHHHQDPPPPPSSQLIITSILLRTIPDPPLHRPTYPRATSCSIHHCIRHSIFAFHPPRTLARINLRRG